MSGKAYLNRFSHITMEKFDGKIYNVQSNDINVVGKIKLKLNVKGVIVLDEVLVTRGMKLGDCLLMGHPAMLNNNISVCPADWGIRIKRRGKNHLVRYSFGEVWKDEVGKGNEKSITTLRDVLHDNYIAKGVLEETYKFVPGVPNLVRMGVNGVPEGSEVLIVGGSEKVDGMVVVEALNVVKNGEIVVEAVYTGVNGRNVKKGTYFLDVEVFCLPVRMVEDDEYARVCMSIVADPEKRAFADKDCNESKAKAIKDKLTFSDYHEHNDQVLPLLTEFPDVIAIKGDKLGVTNILSHEIRLEEGTKPIYIPAYRIPVKIKE